MEENFQYGIWKKISSIGMEISSIGRKFQYWNGRKFPVWNMEKSSSIPYHALCTSFFNSGCSKSFVQFYMANFKIRRNFLNRIG